jgi:hypothetical protein
MQQCYTRSSLPFPHPQKAATIRHKEPIPGGSYQAIIKLIKFVKLLTKGAVTGKTPM